MTFFFGVGGRKYRLDFFFGGGGDENRLGAERVGKYSKNNYCFVDYPVNFQWLLLFLKTCRVFYIENEEK